MLGLRFLFVGLMVFYIPEKQYIINDDVALLLIHKGEAEINTIQRTFSRNFELKILTHFELLKMIASDWLNPWDLRDFAAISRHWRRGGINLEFVAELISSSWMVEN